MAKHHATGTLGAIVRFALIGFLKKLNVAREDGDYGKTDDLINTFTRDGWRKTGDGTIDVELFEETKAGDPQELIAEILTERETKWQALKDAVATDSSKTIELKVFEDIFVSKNGKLITPEYLGVSGNRRSTVFFDAMVARRKAQPPMAIVDEVPIFVKTFDTLAARLECQIGENELKKEGFLPMSDSNRLRSAKRLVELGGTQDMLRRCYSSSIGQKMYWIIELNRRFPAVKIFDRMLLKADQPDWIKISAVRGADLPELGLRTDPEKLDERNKKLKIQGKAPIAPANEADIREYFGNAKSSTSNKDKILEREKIEVLSKNFPLDVSRMMAEVVMQNDTTALEKLRDEANAYNALTRLIEQGEYPEMENLLLGLVRVGKGEQRDNLFKQIEKMLPKPVVTTTGKTEEATKETVKA